MTKLNKSLLFASVISVIAILMTSCRPIKYDSIQEIFKRDSLELHKLISTFYESNVNYFNTYARYSRSKEPIGFRTINVKIDSCSKETVSEVEIVGNLHNWYENVEPTDMSVRVKQGNEWTELRCDSNLDTLNMLNAFKNILASFKNIVGQDRVYLLCGGNRILRNPDLATIDDYVELFLYYHGEHYVLVHTQTDSARQLIEYCKASHRSYVDLDIDNRCEELYDGVYLIGFSSQKHLTVF